jgi:hypothetical protein
MTAEERELEEELKQDIGEVVCINLDTGELRRYDHYALVERGMPSGMTPLSQMTDKDWVQALRKALAR